MLEPKVIVADEPVSALDVSIRSQVLNLMKRLQAEHQRASVVISHDLAVVKYLADRIAVMYLGKVVELGTGDDIYRRAGAPVHGRADQDDPGARSRPPSGPRPRSASAASCPARSTRRPAAASGPAARARRHGAPRRSRCCGRFGTDATGGLPLPAPRARRAGRDRRGRRGTSRARRPTPRRPTPRRPTPPDRLLADSHRVEDERLDLGLVAEPGAPAGRSAMRPDAQLGPEQQARAVGVGGPEPGHPLGRLVDRHPRIVDGAGDQQRRPRARRAGCRRASRTACSA